MGGGDGGLIDRDKTTPSLVRVFWREGGHNSEFDYDRGNYPSQELHFYTWPDATLKELSQLLKDVVPPARKGNARLEFNLVYPGPEGRAKMRTLGVVRNNVKGAADDARSLKEMRYQVGDCLDIAVFNDGGGGGHGRRGSGGRGGGGGGGVGRGGGGGGWRR